MIRSKITYSNKIVFIGVFTTFDLHILGIVVIRSTNYEKKSNKSTTKYIQFDVTHLVTMIVL